jgi:hypothetical protein
MTVIRAAISAAVLCFLGATTFDASAKEVQTKNKPVRLNHKTVLKPVRTESNNVSAEKPAARVVEPSPGSDKQSK